MAERTTLGDVLRSTNGSIKTGPFGTALKAAEYVSDGTPVVSVGEIGYGDIQLDGKTPRVGEDVVARMPEYLLEAGDVVFGRKGAVDRSAWVKPEESGYFLGSDGIRVRFKEGKVHSRFMAYQLQAPIVRDWLLQHAAGTTMASLNQPILESIPIRMPLLPTQKAIAEVLGVLDDKIAANRDIVKRLRAQEKPLFRKVVGSWDERISMTEIATVSKGVSYRSADIGESSTAMVTLKSISRDGSYSEEGLKPYVGDWKPKQVVAPGEIVVAQTDLTQAADVVGRAARVPASRDFERLVASLDLAIVRPKLGVPSEFLLGLMQDSRFKQHCESRTSGTTVLHLGKGAIESFQAPRSPTPIQHRYAEVVQPIHSLQDVLVRQNRCLAEMRDTLLPALMSGRLRVKDAEKVVGEAV